MTFALACLAIGLFLLLMALLGSLLKRLPLTAALIYLFVGVGLGPNGFGLIGLSATPLMQFYTLGDRDRYPTLS